MTFREIIHGSEDYRAEVALRFQVLRSQLAPGAADDDYEAEAGFLHFGLFENKGLVACCFVVPLGGGVGRLRQMAVAAERQKHGLGRRLIALVENALTERGFNRVVLHARDVAKGFYERSGYAYTSDQFLEVGIPHYRMEKSLVSGSTSRCKTG
jgi:predicted GNAT family N-acyltransferase